MKYKVGDKVRIKSLDWYKVQCMNDNYLVIDFMNRDWCGYEMTIIEADENIYHMKEDCGSNYWTDEMIEGLVEEETKPNIIEEAKTYWDSIKDAWICPEGYQFKDENGNVINATKIVLEKKEKEYPKAYEECLKVLGYDDREVYCIFHTGADETLFEALYHLKVCRDAYWKIAGEDVGLNSWKPNWLDDDVTKYVISHDGRTFGTRGGLNYINYILAFPTEEMRDAFYENFKELIEQCKELL